MINASEQTMLTDFRPAALLQSFQRRALCGSSQEVGGTETGSSMSARDLAECVLDTRSIKDILWSKFKRKT